MLTYRSRVTAARPPEKVFQYLTEPGRHAVWSDVPMRQLTDGPLGTGSRLEVTLGMGPIKATIGLELTAVEPEPGWLSARSPVRSGGTRVPPRAVGHRRNRTEPGGSPRIHWPLAARAAIGRRRDQQRRVKELERLKSAVESGDL